MKNETETAKISGSFGHFLFALASFFNIYCITRHWLWKCKTNDLYSRIESSC